jgi:hypothetical protein
MMADQMAIFRSIGLLFGSCSSFIITALISAPRQIRGDTGAM